MQKEQGFVRRWKSLAEEEAEAVKARRGRFVGSVCWSWLKRRDGSCECDPGSADGMIHVHLGGNGSSYPCAQHLNSVLGSGRACKIGSTRCSGDHWSLERLQEALGAEHRTNGSSSWNGEEEESERSAAGVNVAKPLFPANRSTHNQEERMGTRSEESALGRVENQEVDLKDPNDGSEKEAERVKEEGKPEMESGRLAKIITGDAARHGGSYLAAFVREEWFEGFVQDPRLASLLLTKHRCKEITEAYGVASRVSVLLQDLGLPADGNGTVLLDMCSGKGMTGVVLSFKFPRAHVCMLDANGQMNLVHCTARDNLSFTHADIFSKNIKEALRQVLQDRVGIAAGMHLCGSLSPRLIDIFCGISELQGLLLCPCCLKGTLGKTVKLTARKEGRSVEETLTETLADIARNMLQEIRHCGVGGDGHGHEGGHVDGHVWEEEDQEIMSPKRRFVLAVKRHGQGKGGSGLVPGEAAPGP